MDKDETGYDFKSEENSRKWQGLFLGALKQIQKQVHPTLVSKDDGLLYVESLILRLLNSIINSQNKAVGNTSTAVTFHQHADVEAQIKRLFPQPLDRWSMKRAHEILAQLKHHKRSHRALAVTGAFSSGGSSSSSSFSSDRSPPLKTPVDKFHQLLQKELLHHKTDISVSQYILAVLEYIAKDILQLSGHYVRNMTHTEITSQDIRVAMCADKVLMDLFYSDLDEVALGPPPSAGWASGPSGGGGGSVGSGDGGGGNSGGGVYGNSGGGQAFRFDAEALEFGAGEYGNIGARPTYLDAVKELIREERQFGRDLNLIIKVFRDPLVGVLTPAEIERFFGNIDEVLEFSTDFLFSLEDAIELADEEDCPIGACFEDIAEEQAFDVFEKYAAMIMPLALRDELYFIFKREDVAGPLTQRLGEQMMAAMRYVLPQLLLVPIHHCVNSYFKAVANLKELTTSKEDRDSFEQAEALMLPLRSQLAKLAASNKKMGEAYFLRLNGRTNRATALAKMTDIQRAIDGWEGKDIGQSCNEFIMEGPLSKEAGQGGIGHRGSAHRLTERHGFLFDGLLVLCKPNISKRGTAMSVTAAVTGRDPPSSAYDWRLKERFLIRNIEIADRGGDEYREERKRERERKEEEERLKKEKKMEMGEEMEEEQEQQQQEKEKDPETGNSSFYVPATPATPSSSSAFSASSSTLNTLVSEHSPLVPETSANTSSTTENSSSANPNSNGNNSKDNQNPNSSTTNAASNSTTTTTPLSDFIHAFEIKSRPNLQSSGIVLVTKTPEEKDRWMSQLILLNTRSMLERTLDSRLQEEAKKHPLQLPHPSHYRFATEDFDTNIIFEETRSSMLSSSSSSNVPLIKGATLLKLIERLTYHKYGDPALVRTFLTTYRSFCTPTELLKLLIERFEIPNPDLSSCLQAMHFANQELASPTSIHPSMGGLNHQQNHLQHQQNHHQHQHQNHQSEAIVGSPVTASAEETTGGVQENSTITAQGPPTSPISPTTSIMSDFSSNTFTFLTGAEEGGNTPADTEQQQRDYTEMVKKFRKEYAEPVQFRVMNVLRHWIENHYYDFERDPSLLEALTEFLERKKRPQPSTASASASAPNGPTTTTTATTSSSSLNLESMSIVGGSMISLLLKAGPESVQAVPRTMRKLIEHLTKVIDRKKDQASKQKETSREIMHNSVAPAIEWWLTREEEEFDLLTLHPVEIARQLTLLEFELYCAVKPSELVGTEQGKTGVWTKKDKQKTSPNLLKLIYHNSNFTYYLEKCIIEAENFEERVAILLRIIEIMIVLQELNNFNGVIEVMSALHSASVFRLEHTMARIESNSKLKKAFDEGLELMQDHFKKYQDKLRSINPPCVPFFGTYLTNILHLEEGNPEYLSPPQHLENMSLHDTSGILSDEAVNCKLINFSKKRKVAEITGEIQQYQNQPYCLKVEPTIRHFLENLAPHTGMTEREFDDYLYTRSMVIEPRGAKQPVKNPRKWPSRQLKSPGIKTVKQRFIPLMSIDPLISNFTSYAHNHGSSSHHHQNSGQQNSTPNSANSQHQHPDLDSLSQQISPPTPLTPPHSATSFHHHSHSHSHQSHHSHHRHSNHHHHSRHNSNNDTIFANVIIGGGGGGQRDGPSASPTTPVHHSASTTSNCFNFPVSGQSPAGQLPDGSFLPTPPPLPPRTNRGMNSSVLLQQQQQSPRTRFPPFPPPSALAYSEGGNNEGFSSPISTNSNSPPPLPPRSHLSGGGGGGGTLSRSTSLAQAVHSLREPPPVPSQPHPTSSSSHHGTPPPPPLPPFGGALPLPPPSSLPPFVQHQRVSSDITSLSSSSTNGGIPTTVGGPILRRNSTLEPIPSSKRYSHGNPPPPLPSMQGGASSASGPSSSSSPSPLHTPLLTPPSASSLTPLHPPHPPHSSLQSPSSSSSTLAMSPGGGGGGGGSLGGVPELPPKTYRLSSACRLTEEVLAKTTYPSSTMTNK